MDRSQVEAILGEIATPKGGNLLRDGLVRALEIDGAVVRFVLEIDPAEAAAMEAVRAEAEARLRGAGATQVSIAMTAHSAPKPPDLNAARAANPLPSPERLKDVRHVVLVGSGKGGVGKSTVSSNLAVALAQQGLRVGLLDADIYGPSQHKMFGITQRPASPDGTRIVPLRNHGVAVMSIGMMLRGDEAVIWRGPKLLGALQQLLFQVAWGALDVLVVDLPPGTGDVQLTLAQKLVLSGALVVSTPQDIALIDARKAVDMFEKTGVPILGLVENMATHRCSKCGHEEAIFGAGGVAAEAGRIGAPLLASLPLALDVRQAGDAGAPLALDGNTVFEALARDVWAALERG